MEINLKIITNNTLFKNIKALKYFLITGDITLKQKTSKDAASVHCLFCMFIYLFDFFRSFSLFFLQRIIIINLLLSNIPEIF